MSKFILFLVHNLCVSCFVHILLWCDNIVNETRQRIINLSLWLFMNSRHNGGEFKPILLRSHQNAKISDHILCYGSYHSVVIRITILTMSNNTKLRYETIKRINCSLNCRTTTYYHRNICLYTKYIWIATWNHLWAN